MMRRKDEMVNGILGKKIGMTQVYDDQGNVHPVTVLQAGPCVITQLKRVNKDGYDSAQIGFVEFVKGKNVTGPMNGHFAKHNLPPGKFMLEVPMKEAAYSYHPAAQPIDATRGNKSLVANIRLL